MHVACKSRRRHRAHGCFVPTAVGRPQLTPADGSSRLILNSKARCDRAGASQLSTSGVDTASVPAEASWTLAAPPPVADFTDTAAGHQNSAAPPAAE